MIETVKTVALLGLLTGLFLGAGYYLGGSSGAAAALVFSLLMNFFAYWYSDKIVLRMYNAREISKTENAGIHKLIEEISGEAKIPKPKIYLVDQKAPNAFATGRDPKHGALAVTTGLMEILDKAEIKGVLAHEIAHIKNRDTLTSTLAATFAGALAFTAQMAYYGALFGGRDRNRNPIGLILMVIFVPLAATIVRLAISRSREFAADRTGAIFIQETEGLASALSKISDASKHVLMKGNPATSHMFIINPFKGDLLMNLLSTHPSTEARIRSLKSLKL
ncbi:MAG: zinc metalloprotease HtpX [Candidatus Aenigmarchaeota archaeon]|nr:zinc metalloprotease HtpX [Candidatus Aenigmarchaeota archaeon]MBI4174423.1 zinc metalloprotease HtpX [Candidatus Aenigmarchaeota archaeon]